MFKIGQKVVCIDDDFNASRNGDSIMGLFNNYPVKDKTYTVRGYDKLGTGIYVEEIVNFPGLYMGTFGEKSFKPDKFVPLEDIVEVNEAVAEITSVLNNVMFN